MLVRLLAAALGAAFLTGHAEAQRGGAHPQITVFEHPNYEGRSMVIGGQAPNLQWVRFNDMISSILVEGGQWELCLDADYRGTC